MCEVSFFLFIIGVIGKKKFLRQDRFVTYMKDHYCLYLAARIKDVESPSSFTFSDFMFTSAPYSIWIKVRNIITKRAIFSRRQIVKGHFQDAHSLCFIRDQV